MRSPFHNFSFIERNEYPRIFVQIKTVLVLGNDFDRDQRYISSKVVKQHHNTQNLHTPDILGLSRRHPNSFLENKLVN